jgi:serine/threonine protein kinase
MGNAATVTSDVTKQAGQALVGGHWDEDLWSRVAGNRETISAAEWIAAVRVAERAAGDARFKAYSRLCCLHRGRFGEVAVVKRRQRGGNNLGDGDGDSDGGKRLFVMKTVDRCSRFRELSGWCTRGLRDEAFALVALRRHPNVVEYVEVLDFGRRHRCIVMAFCASGDLRQRVKSAAKRGRHIKQHLVMSWFTQVVLGLHHLHAHGLPHTGLMPESVFLSRRNRVAQVGGFHFTPAPDAGGLKVPLVNALRAWCFKSPELFFGPSQRTPQADIWCVYVCVYVCVLVMCLMCACARVCVFVCICVRMCVRACVHLCVCGRACACVRACVRACARARAACVRAACVRRACVRRRLA